MQLSQQTDILIVGNGALGLFLADELVRRRINKHITVVGPKQRPGGASQAAGAMLGCFCEVTTGTFSSELGRARFEIGLKAHELWDDAINRLEQATSGRLPLKVANDTHVILNSVGSEFDATNFDAIMAALEAYDRPWTEADPAHMNGFNPKPDCRAFRAIKLPTEGAVDARRILAALETTLQKEEVQLVDSTVKAILSKNGTVTGVELQGGTILEAETVVVAAGAQSEQLVNTASDCLEIVPTFAGLGLGLISKRTSGTPFSSVVRTPNRAFACGLHVVPGGEGTEYLGSTNRIVPQFSTGASFEDLSYYTRCAMQQLDENIANHQLQQLLVGNRPITLDGFPLVGALPMSGLYLMTGTYRDGLHGAPQFAVYMANEILGRPDVIYSDFAPSRPAIVNRTVEQSVDEFVQHSVAMWYESSADAPFSTNELTSHRREQAYRQYDHLGVDYGLSPDVLWYTLRYPGGARKIIDYFSARTSIAPAASVQTLPKTA